MNTFNACVAVGSILTILLSCVLSCFLSDNCWFYPLRTKAMIARVIIASGIVGIISFGYTMLWLVLTDTLNRSQFVPNLIGSMAVTLILAALGWFLFALQELPILREYSKAVR